MTKQMERSTTIESGTEYGPVEVSLFTLEGSNGPRHILNIEQQDGVDEDGNPTIDVVSLNMTKANELIEIIVRYKAALAETGAP